MVSCPNCDLCNYSYKEPTENDPEIILTCESCGTEWSEPNQKYIDAKKRELEDQYFNRFL
jgi:uncharacterized Zn ribbon protein